jgi:predicted transcriptional regulator
MKAKLEERNEDLAVTFNVRMTERDREAVSEIAMRDDRSAGSVVRQAIRQYAAVRRAVKP